MEILDTNVIVRHLARDNPDQQARADAFFRRLASGSASVRIPEGVLVETVQVLASKALYSVPRDTIRAWLDDLVQQRGVTVANVRLYRRALEIFASQAQLSFVDSLCVAYAEREEAPAVVTFDRGFSRVGTILRREP